jgi:hypothetical protein
MSNAIIEDATGKVLNIIDGTIPLEGGQSFVTAENCSIGDTWDGATFVKRVRPPLTYDIARAYDYASTGDQLDMMYWDSVNGTRIWLDHIAAVKAAHPKPE